MTNILITLLLSFPIMLIAAFLVGGGVTLIQVAEEWWDKKQRRKQIAKEYDYWHDKALSCTDFGLSAILKGKAAACMAVLKEELRVMEEGESN